jgi:hypothetical protein
MTLDEFLSLMKNGGAESAPAATDAEISMTATLLQNIRASSLPQFIIDLYAKVGGMILGDAYIFGPNELKMTDKFPVPTIAQINREISGIASMRGRTVFARNDLFWFAFDAFGNVFMLDNARLAVLRKYDDPYRAMTDCMAVGKI